MNRIFNLVQCVALEALCLMLIPVEWVLEAICKGLAEDICDELDDRQGGR